MADKQKRVLLVDDSAIVASQLSAMIERTAGYEVAGRAKSGVEALKLYRELKPDVVLMDIVMPDMDGISALRSILATDRSAHVVMVSSVGGVAEKVTECLRLGAKGVVSKPFDEDVLTRALKRGEN